MSEVSIQDCEYCKYYDFDGMRKCTNSKCLCLGSSAYEMYEEVDESEKLRRQNELRERRAQKDHNRKIFKMKFVMYLMLLCFGIILILLVSLLSLIYNWNHPEMTMMMLQYTLNKYGLVALLGILSIWASNLVFKA